jgi:anthranilate synthase component 1
MMGMNIFPSQEEFCRLAQTYTVVPVYTELAVDTETPVSLYYKLVGDQAGFMLESAESNKNFGRYSFIGADPFAIFTARKNHSEIRTGMETTCVEGPPLEAMQAFLTRYNAPDLPGMPPFTGGGVGYFAYEIVATWERIRGLEVPDDTVLAEFLFCNVLIIMDHLTHSAKLVYLTQPGADRDAAVAYNGAREQLSRFHAMLSGTASAPPLPPPQSDRRRPGSLASPESGETYRRAVEQAKEYIKAGDAFQIVLSQAFHLHLANPDSFKLYRRLRQLNPSPYMFYINFGHRQLVGASPEMLVKVQQGKAYTCPIAGTRPRGSDTASDARLADELLADEKERAEHAMLVDLGRNDLGRISIPGTVTVTRLMEVEMFSHVMHLVSEVTGEIASHYQALDVLKACFPAGTLSGAPKVRAMEIIYELEQKLRGTYGGAVGYLDFKGNMDTCITIRTMELNGGEVKIQTGAGIVADSVPATEYQEILHKAQAVYEVARGGEADDSASG